MGEDAASGQGVSLTFEVKSVLVFSSLFTFVFDALEREEVFFNCR
jgi:hypothetical protein